jgi:hypothetical protein
MATPACDGNEPKVIVRMYECLGEKIVMENRKIVIGEANEFGAEIRRRGWGKIREVDGVIKRRSGFHVRDGDLGAVLVRR